MKQKVLLATIVVVLSLGLLAGSFAPVYATDGTPVWWNVAGDWAYTGYYLGTPYDHSMTISSFDPITGYFTGTGFYLADPSLTWTVEGIVSCNTILMLIVYDPPYSYWVIATGTIASDGMTMGGDWNSYTGPVTFPPPAPYQTGTWTATGQATLNGQNAGTFVNAGCVPPDSTLVLNIQYKVVNDEDSGFYGYWALDNYNKHVQVWQLPDDSFYAVVRYEGKWHTFEDALSPQNGIPESRDAYGTFQGGYIATFGATGFTATFGNIRCDSTSFTNCVEEGRVFDFGGTRDAVISGTLSPGFQPFSFLDEYFSGVTNFDQPIWGWTYHYRSQTWKNFSSGSTGDIVV